MDIKQTRFTMGPDFMCTDAGSDWIIEGFASTDAVDSYNEVVDPSAFAEHLSEFNQFPILLLNHQWFDKPVGKIVLAEIKKHGLWVRALISKTAADVWTLIEEGILKAFSIGFNGVFGELISSGPWMWRKIQLLEISIVNIPANREALFAIAQSKGFDLSRFQQSIAVQPQQKTGGTGMSEITLDQVKEVVAGEMKAISPTLEAAAKQAAADAVKSHVSGIEVMKGDLTGQLKMISEALQKCSTKSELESMKDKVTADVSAIMAENNRLNARGLPDLREQIGSTPGYSRAAFEADLAREYGVAPAYVKALVNKPEHLSSNPNAQQAAKNFHEAHDTLYLLDVLAAGSSKTYRGPQTLKYWSHYAKLAAEFRKAMDTATATEGAEWIPTGFSADLQDRVELALVVANKFRAFPMPTNPYSWPFKSTRGTAYKQGESLADASSKYTATTPLTAKTTFTASKIAMRVLTSDEFVEDSIVPIIPFLRDEIVTTIARGIDNCILNGDTARTQDSDDTSATGVTACWNGLRLKALAAAGSKADIGAVTVADLLAVLKLLGAFAGNPLDVHAFFALREYITLLGDSSIQTIANFGQQSTLLTGTIFNLYGVAVSASEFQRQTLNASGVYDGVTMTKSSLICAHKPTFLIGDRRMITVKTDEDIETGQMILVGTVRKDFQAIQSGSYPVAIGYNAS